MTKSIEDAAKLWFLIETLSSEEGDSVTILCPNPDFNNLPDYAIECNGYFTNYQDRRFTGNNYFECLQEALNHKEIFYKNLKLNFKNRVLGV